MPAATRSQPLGGARTAATAAALACILGAAYLGSTWRQEIDVRNASDAASAGDYRRAIAEASKVSRAPTLVRALAVRGRAELAIGDAGAAEATFRRAAGAAPNDADIRRDWAVALTRLGRTTEAGRQLSRAIALDPGISLPGFIH